MAVPIVNGILAPRCLAHPRQVAMRAFQKFDPAAFAQCGFRRSRLLNLLKLLNRAGPSGTLAALATLAGPPRQRAIPGRLRIGRRTSTSAPRYGST